MGRGMGGGASLERRDEAHMGFSERTDAILNWAAPGGKKEEGTFDSLTS